jgi:hypothetical protein
VEGQSERQNSAAGRLEETGFGFPLHERHHQSRRKQQPPQQNQDHNPPAAMDGQAFAVGEEAGLAAGEECGEIFPSEDERVRRSSQNSNIHGKQSR